MYDIDTIRVMYSKRAVEPTEHFYKRLKERIIKFADVKNAVMNGEIIEQSLNDYPNPSILILGYACDGSPLHIAAGVGDDRLFLITVYYPTLDIWEAGYRVKRAVE